MLLARIHEAIPLACPICHAQMRIIAVIHEGAIVPAALYRAKQGGRNRVEV